jgi:ribosomal protein L11 methyltransferase
MSYWQYTIHIDPERAEPLLGLLSILPFNSFTATEDGWLAYLSDTEDWQALEVALQGYQSIIPFTFEKEKMPDQNWNAVWESNFQPIQVGTFCGVRADFHPPFDGVKYDLVIQPKMAFGTGHHETTYMMMEQMEKLEWPGKKVLDYGAGTGILAILAAQLGAATIDAVEIEAPACENAIENTERNGTPQVRVIAGTLDAVPKQSYDIILANINRNVILDSMSALFAMTADGGTILFSGVLHQDGDQVLRAAQNNGFVHRLTQQKGEWLCMVFEKQN